MTINANYANANTYTTATSWGFGNANASQKDTQATSNTYLTPENSTTTSFMSEFGFRINERGIFDKEFNKAANLPESYEINIKSVQSIAKVLANDENSASKLDMPELISRYFSTLRSVESEFASADNASLSRGEIASLNQGFSTQSGEFDGIINRIYANTAQLKQARIDNKNLNPLGLDNKIIDFSFNSAIKNTANNEFIKPYINKGGEVSKSGLLMNFVYENAKKPSMLFVDALNLSFADHQKFYQMLDDENSLKNFISEQNKGSMSFDFYLYTQGINKEAISDERLLAAYQQYLTSVKKANIDNFASQSSIYQLYTQILMGKFNTMQSDYDTQSKSEVLALANEMRTKSAEGFAQARQRQASRETIIKSYKSIMAS